MEGVELRLPYPFLLAEREHAFPISPPPLSSFEMASLHVTKGSGGREGESQRGVNKTAAWRDRPRVDPEVARFFTSTYLLLFNINVPLIRLSMPSTALLPIFPMANL